MSEQSAESKISNIIKTIRSWSVLWDLDELLKEIIKNSVVLLNADQGYLLLLESNGLVVKSIWANPDAQPLEYLPEIAEKVIRHGVAVYAHDIKRRPNLESQIYCVPMTANRGVLGVIYIELLNRKDEITEDEKLVFEMLGLQAASFLENSILYHSAITDPLTGLYSHRHFQQECDQMIRRSARTQSEVSLIILDLDHFKQLNDKFGHEEGNICLKRISEILKNKFRSTDIIARFGGDEFEILLPDTNIERALCLANELINLIKNEKFPLQISGTIGLATFPNHANDSQSLFLAADQALYVGKNKGRNCVVVSTIDSKTRNENSSINIETKQSKPNDSTSIHSAFPENIKKDIQKIDGLDVVSRIASSSNGEVLLVRQHELERFVALKRPLTAHLTEEQSAAFKKEAYLTASLSHPGVVPLYTMGQGLDGRLYYTMKPIKGQSLEELLKKWEHKESQTIKDYNLIKLTHILLKACETVAYAHSRNIAHLDIHPGNIIIGEFGEITLIDWGKGIKVNEINKETSTSGIYVSGSPVYRAPEQILKGQVGKFTDVYSLGIILFEILTDKTPFQKKTTKETIEAIILGIENSQESSNLNYGVDPLLANACKLAISKNIEKRISAVELCNSLSRFAMLEADIKTHLFQTAEKPISENDWKNIFPNIKWQLQDGVWSSTEKNQQHMIYWKTPVTGNFSFTCEGWVTKTPRELALICYGKSIKDTSGWGMSKELYKGYWFQFGADNNLYTKLARHGEDILVDANFTCEPNRKYLITISYQDGWLHCYIDKALVFQYRELHPFKGFHIGLYAYGDCSHFKPIEIRYQNSGLMIPSIRLADEHFAFNQFEIAIKRYNEIINEFPDRLEGLESQLKKGYCYTRLGKIKEANEAFNKLKNTILEPYALAGIAMIELPSNEYEVFQKDGDYKKAYLDFKNIIDKFPRHQAIFRILSPCQLLRYQNRSNHIFFKKNREETLHYKAELLRLGTQTLAPPGQTQIVCLDGLLDHLATLGHWNEAITIIKNYLSNFKKYMINHNRLFAELLYICYCCDELDLFKCEIGNIEENINIRNSHPVIVLNCSNRQELLLNYEKTWGNDSFRELNYRIIFNLALKNDLKLEELFNLYYRESNSNPQIINRMRNYEYYAFEILLAYDKSKLKEVLFFLESFSKESNEHLEASKILKHYYLSIIDLFNFDFSNCLKNINESNNLPTKIHSLQEKRLLVTSLLYSLEYMGDLNKDELLFQNKIYLAGISLEIANGFLTGKLFTLSEKWAKVPTDNFFELALYCIWLYEKQEIELLKQTLKKLINPKLGNAYFQPFFIALEKRKDDPIGLFKDA